MIRILSIPKRIVAALLHSEQLLAEIRAGVANLGRMEPLLADIRDEMAHVASTQPVGATAPMPYMPSGVVLDGGSETTSDTESGEDALGIPGVQQIPCPIISPIRPADLLALISDPSFLQCAEFFSNSPSAARSLVSPHFQALMYTLVRNTKPRDVLEIGTYRAATSEAICRALHANGAGLLHTVDPYGDESVPPILRSWPREIARHARFYAMDSMLFFERMKALAVEPYIVFIDGNHDYEFAAFDIEAASQQVSPGGWILVDNISQPGPFMAARDFLARNPEWAEEAVISDKPADPPYDGNRTTIINTDCAILRRPAVRTIRAQRPQTAGQQSWGTSSVGGVDVPLSAPATGILKVQCILRSFGTPLMEKTASEEVELHQASGPQRLVFDPPLQAPDAIRYTVETWLIWDGDEPLQLSGKPSAF